MPVSSLISSNENPEQFKFPQVTDRQVENVIRRLPSNKAPGMDKVSATMLKDSLRMSLSIITRIVSSSFATSTFIRAWETVEVTLFKSGNPEAVTTRFHFCR